MPLCPQMLHVLIDLSPLPSQLTTTEHQLDHILDSVWNSLPMTITLAGKTWKAEVGLWPRMS